MFGKVPLYPGPEPVAFARQLAESALVDRLGAAVMGAEGDIPLVLGRDKTGNVALIERRYAGRVEPAVAYPVEQCDKCLV